MCIHILEISNYIRCTGEIWDFLNLVPLTSKLVPSLFLKFLIIGLGDLHSSLLASVSPVLIVAERARELHS